MADILTLGAPIKTAYEDQPDTNAFTDAEKTKLAGVEAGAQICNTANVQSAGAVMASLYDAQSVLVAVTNNNPVVVELAENTIIGRADGNVKALNQTEAKEAIGLETAVISDTTGVSGAGQVTNMMRLTQAAYDLIPSPSSSTLYIITD